MNDQDVVPLWQKLTAGGAILILIAAAAIFHSRLGADFWPVDDARVAPNILATIIQILVVSPFAVLLWPPTRRRLHRFVDRKIAPFHDHFAKMHAHQEWEAQQRARHMRAVGLEPDPHPHHDISRHSKGPATP
jgi:hypothetical protein